MRRWKFIKVRNKLCESEYNRRQMEATGFMNKYTEAYGFTEVQPRHM